MKIYDVSKNMLKLIYFKLRARQAEKAENLIVGSGDTGDNTGEGSLSQGYG